ncbi:hypothetical protein V5O48_001238 [Marasmius crinis-equi]|uniref:Uncharacterized protein n=1 Tax=Marasmius crinis-equi TaxID=585013 RepID=A0ABR3FYY2_9AGAR
MSSSAFRRVSTPARIIRRHVSSDAKSSTPSKSYFLTPEKKRALVSLYHQSDTFITPENLSERIDEAFLKNKSGDLQHLFNSRVTTRELEHLVREQENAPKFSEWDRDRKALVRVGVQWSGSTLPREWRVIEALYGVDASDSRNAMPGLEALEEFVQTEEGKELEKSKSS